MTSAMNASTPMSCGELGELLEKPDADASALIVVRHHERRLGDEWVAKANVVRDRDDPFLVELAHNGDERASFVPIGSDEARARRLSPRRNRESGDSGFDPKGGEEPTSAGSSHRQAHGDGASPRRGG